MRRLAVAVALVACRGTAAKHVATGTITRTQVVHHGDLAPRVLLTGSVHAANATSLSVPKVDSWQIPIRWLAEDGATVKAGDRVVELDNSAFIASLDEKRLAMLDARSALATARDLSRIETENKENELRQHRISLEKAKVRADVPPDLLPAREAQERQLEKKRMEVAVKKAEEDLAAQKAEAELDLQVKQIELDKVTRAIEAAEKTIDELVLKAPKDGIVVISDHPWFWPPRKFHLGDTVQPGMTIVSMPDLSQAMEVQSDLSDVDDGRVTAGMTGTCTLDAYPTNPVACTVRDLTPVARTPGEQSMRRAFALTLTLAKSDTERMRPGMSVEVVLAAPPVKNVIVVPRAAIVVEGHGAGATSRVRLAGGMRDVKLGTCDAQGCEVQSGVADGDTVIVEGS